VSEAISEIVGKTIESVSRTGEEFSEEVRFETQCGRRFVIRHNQDCCEEVRIQSVEGDLQSLVGKRTNRASSEFDNELPEGIEKGDLESYTRSIFCINDVVITFFGFSNGYYDESATMQEIDVISGLART